MKQTLILLTTVLILQSCASSSTSQNGGGTATTVTQSNPEAPKESYLYKGKQVEKNVSTIGIPFEITMADVERQINANIKDLVFEDNSMEDNNYDNFMCKVYKRDNIVVTTQNEAFTFNVPLRVWAKVGYKVMGMSIPPQELNFEFNVKFGSKFSIAPNWEANVQSFPIGYDWIKKPTVRLAGFDISVAGLVERALNSKQDAILKALDDAVRKNVEIKKENVFSVPIGIPINDSSDPEPFIVWFDAKMKVPENKKELLQEALKDIMCSIEFRDPVNTFLRMTF